MALSASVTKKDRPSNSCSDYSPLATVAASIACPVARGYLERGIVVLPAGFVDGRKPPAITKGGNAYPITGWKSYRVDDPRYIALLQDALRHGQPPAWGRHTDTIACLDIDLKRFPSASEMDAATEDLRAIAPNLTRTMSGGYHIDISTTDAGGNMGLGGIAHVGELLSVDSDGRPQFVVISGPDYEVLKSGEPLTAPLDSIGFYRTSAPKPAPKPAPPLTVVSPTRPPDGAVALVDLITKPATAILGGDGGDDPSAALTRLARECWGWENLAGDVGIAIFPSADQLIADGALALGREFKLDACLKKIDRGTCKPGLESRRGRQACVAKLRRLATREKAATDNSGGKLKRLDKLELHRLISEKYPAKWDVWDEQIYLDDEPFVPEDFHIKLALECGVDVGKDTAIDVLEYVARDNPRDKVLEYLQSLENAPTLPREIWDNEMAKYCLGHGERLDNIAIRKTLLAAVARVFKPGCKADECPILQGPQGVRKSSFLKALGGDFFNENLNLSGGSDDETRAKMRRHWIHEIAEFDKLTGKREASEIKAFVSEAVDNYRPKYARRPQQFPRRCIVVGTANPPQFLVDPTGNRRYPIIKVPRRIDIEKIEANRDLIWATAVQAYHRGESWHYNAEETAMINARAEEFAYEDPWDSAVMDYLESRDIATISGILEHVLKIEPAKQNSKETGRVGRILTRLGWSKGARKRLDGRLAYPWYAPPSPCQLELESCDSVDTWNDINRRYSQLDVDTAWPRLTADRREKITGLVSAETVEAEPTEADVMEVVELISAAVADGNPRTLTDALATFSGIPKAVKAAAWRRLPLDTQAAIKTHQEMNHHGPT